MDRLRKRNDGGLLSAGSGPSVSPELLHCKKCSTNLDGWSVVVCSNEIIFINSTNSKSYKNNTLEQCISTITNDLKKYKKNSYTLCDLR